ncbi:MAG: ribonuclease HII [Candidatus Saccharimonas sp.]
MIVGIDEVGRGPWAGPLVMGAVVLGCEIEGLADSKQLSKKRREELDVEIRDKALAVGLGWVSAQEIDTLGLASALQLACRRALEEIDALGVAYHEIIIDGTINFLRDTGRGQYVTTLKKADSLIPSVSAASIVAKVARDTYMAEQDELYPGYKFGSHVGYGTAVHRAAIEQLGVTPLHRLSFAPLQKYAEQTGSPVHPLKPVISLTTRKIGDASETAAANELVRRGHEILERNWRTKYCEIDIVSRKDNIVYFTEVKHRRNNKGGDGLAAITPKKLNQMAFAAKLFVHTNHLEQLDLRLLAVATAGDTPEVVTVVEIH